MAKAKRAASSTVEDQTENMGLSITGDSSVPSAGVMPVFTAHDMQQSLAAYKALQNTLDTAMPEAMTSIHGTLYRNKSYWRAIRAAFGLTLECTHDERVEYPVGEGLDWGWLVRYRATSPNGSFADGDGSCFASEKERGSMAATVHNVRAHAHTRAKNRAIADLVGFGEVSADEIMQYTNDPSYYDPPNVTVFEDSPHDPDASAPQTKTNKPDPNQGRTTKQVPPNGTGTEKRYNEDGQRLITAKQQKMFHAILKQHNRDGEQVKNHLVTCFGSERSEDIPFSDFNDVLEWLKDDGKYNAAT